MKFDYTPEELETRKPVAALHAFAGGPEECLAIKVDESKTVWLYPDGEVSPQSGGLDLEGGPKKVFYEGDSITITF